MKTNNIVKIALKFEKKRCEQHRMTHCIFSLEDSERVREREREASYRVLFIWGRRMSGFSLPSSNRCVKWKLRWRCGEFLRGTQEREGERQSECVKAISPENWTLIINIDGMIKCPGIWLIGSEVKKSSWKQEKTFSRLLEKFAFLPNPRRIGKGRYCIAYVMMNAYNDMQISVWSKERRPSLYQTCSTCN